IPLVVDVRSGLSLGLILSADHRRAEESLGSALAHREHQDASLRAQDPPVRDLLRILGRAPDPLPADQVLRVLERGFVVRSARRHVRAAEDQVRRLQQACAAEIDRLYQEEKYEAALEPFTFSREHWQDRRRDITREVKGRFKERLKTAEHALHDAEVA